METLCLQKCLFQLADCNTIDLFISDHHSIIKYSLADHLYRPLTTSFMCWKLSSVPISFHTPTSSSSLASTVKLFLGSVLTDFCGIFSVFKLGFGQTQTLPRQELPNAGKPTQLMPLDRFNSLRQFPSISQSHSDHLLVVPRFKVIGI